MDCVYHAYADYLEHMDIKPTRFDYLYYKLLKQWTHGSRPQYTFGGVAPWIINKLAGGHKIKRMTAFYRIYTPRHYLDYAEKYYPAHYKRMASAIYNTNWVGVSEIVFPFPAIYLLLGGQHAVFADKAPSYGMPDMAIF
jgi:hypothetical protein